MSDIGKTFQRIGIDKNYEGMNFEGYSVDLQGWNAEHPIFERIIETFRPRLMIEVGTWKGASTINLLKFAEKHHLDVQIICIDTWLGSSEILWLRDEFRPLLNLQFGFPSLFPQFVFNMIESGVMDKVFPLPLTSTAAARLLQQLDVTVDAVYVDAGHSEEEVFNDLNLYYNILKPGGVLFGDDYHHTWPGVVSAVNRFVFEKQVVMTAYLRKFMLTKPE